MPNYINIIGSCFPGAEAYVSHSGNPEVYTDINWVSASIPKNVLDNAAANNCQESQESLELINVSNPQPGQTVIYDSISGTFINVDAKYIQHKSTEISSLCASARISSILNSPTTNSGILLAQINIIPIRQNSTIEISSSFNFVTSNSNQLVVMTFRTINGVTTCINSNLINTTSGKYDYYNSQLFLKQHNTNSTITVSTYLALSSSGTFYINSRYNSSTTTLMGGSANNSWFTLREIME
jgi:hypothetical protein